MNNMSNAAVMETTTTAVEFPANVEAQKLARKKAEKIALENTSCTSACAAWWGKPSATSI